MEFGSDVLYVSKELEEEEIEELDYYSPSADPAPGSFASAPTKRTYKPSKSAKYKDDGEVSLSRLWNFVWHVEIQVNDIH